VKRDELGFHHVRLAQVFRGIEVADGEMLFHFNRDAALYLVTAHYFPTPELPERKPKLNAAAAIRATAAALSAKPGAWPVALKIWLGPRATAKLAYEVTALDRGWRIFVDASTGKILDRVPTNSSDTAASQRPIAPNP
jgi:Zn-dependent metalloprotease